MTKNPFLNAFTAAGYIILVASFMFYGTKQMPHANSIIVPITMLSIFTLSAAVMGYLFFGQPVLFYLDGKKKQAVDLFLQTLGVFAGITIIAILLLLSGEIH